MKSNTFICRTILSVFLVLMLFVSASLWAQGSRGKVTGTVIDVQTNSGLVGANIIVVGSNFGGSTDSEGRYFILGLLPGTYSLRATYMGYTTTTKEDVKVSIDRTTTIDFELEPTVIPGKEVVITAERERIRTDISFTQTSLGEADVRLAPVGMQLREVLRTQPGVELDDQGRLSIRGSGYDEVGFVVDGVNQSDARFNVSFTNIPKAAIKEVQILTGGFNAEYGEARSGLVNIVTKEGGNEYTGTLHIRYRPEGLKHRGPNIYSPDNYWDVGRYLSMEPTGDLDGDGAVDFKGWTQAFADGLRTPAFQVGDQTEWKEPANVNEALEIWKFRHRGFDYGNEPDYYIEGTVGGPIPFTPVKFFFSGFYNKEMFPFPMIRPDYVEYNSNLKLTWDARKNLKIKFLAGYGEVHTASHAYLGGSPDAKEYNIQSKFMTPNWDNALYQGNMSLGDRSIYNMDSFASLLDINRATIGTQITWIKSSKTYVEFQLSKNHSIFGTPETRRRDRTTVVKTVGDVLLDESPVGYDITGPDRDQLSVYRIAGRRGFSDFSKNITYRTRLDWTSQVTVNHQLKAGIGFNYFFSDMKYGTNSMTDDPTHVEHQRNWTERDARESEGFVYTQDKIEFKGLIMNVGFRLDAFSPLTKDLVYDYDPNTTADYNYLELYVEVPQEGRGFRVKPETHWALSPRVGVSHPIGDNSKLFFNYGYFYQRPVMFNQYADVRNRRGRLEYLGNPNLDFTKSIAYELGIEQNLFSNFLVRLSGYYRDVSRAWGRTWNQTSRLDQTVGYKTYLNNRYGDIRGFEITLEKHGRYIDGRINYDHMWTSSGFVGQTQYFQDPNEIVYRTDFFNPVAEAAIARPRLNTMITFFTPSKSSKFWMVPFTNMSFTFYFRWREGRHFTWHGSPLYPGTDERDPNNVKWKADHRTDLRIQKSIKVGPVSMRPYLEITNLFDYNYIYWPEGSGAGFGFNVYPVQDAFTNYMDWVKEEGKTPGDYKDIPVNAESRHQYLLWNQPRDIRFGAEFDL